MTCSEFDKAFDPYVDGVLGQTGAAAARAHIESCPTCERMVARWQQSRILLSTAVAEIATAVDVSGLLRAVEGALDGTGDVQVAVPHSTASRRAVRERELRADRGARVGAAVSIDRATRRSDKPGRFVVLRRFATVAGASAVAAAASIVLLNPGTSQLVQVATRSTASRVFDGSSVRPVVFETRAPSEDRGWRPLLPVPALVDALEAGSGHTVSTWVQPRTQTRVIWVQSRPSGPTVQMAGYEK